MNGDEAYILAKSYVDKQVATKCFGFKRNRADSNPATRITYIGNNAGFEPVSVNLTDGTFSYGSWQGFIEELCRPVMVKYDGTIAYELYRDDTTKKKDGTASDIANADFLGNAMVEFSKYKYVSRLTIGDYDWVYFSNIKLNDTYKADAFIGEDLSLKDHFMFSMFDGSYDGAKLRSIGTGEVMRNTTASTEMSRAKANGTGWNIGAWSQLNYIWDILTLLGKSDNLQNTFGKGISGFSWNGGVNPYGWNVGASKDKGAFYGESAGTDVVRTLWIEDLWGRAFDRYNGLVNVNGTIKVKMTPPYPTPTDSADTYADYTEVGTTPAEGYVKTALCGNYGFIPTATGGSDTTYFCDYFYKNDSGVKFALVGGAWNIGGRCGRYVDVRYAASYSYVVFGSRLSLI